MNNLSLNLFYQSDIGGRDYNEDYLGFCKTEFGTLFIIADGMGSSIYGHIAAQLVCHLFLEYFERVEHYENDIESFLKEITFKINKQVFQYVVRKNLNSIPRSTIAVALIHGGFIHTIHAGDSRILIFNEKKTIFKTKDHSKVQLLVERGVIDPIESLHHPERHKIYSCIGLTTDLLVEYNRIPLHPEYYLMLSTDGVWPYIEESEFYFQCHKNFLAAGSQMMNRARELGGHNRDNASMILFSCK